MANQSPKDRNRNGGDVTKAERRSVTTDKTVWADYAGHTGEFSSDEAYREE